MPVPPPNRYLREYEPYYGPHWESEPGTEGATESVVFERPNCHRIVYSPTEMRCKRLKLGLAQ